MGRVRESVQRNTRQVCPRVAEDNVALQEQQAALWEADRASWACDQPVTAWLASHLALVPVSDLHLPTATTDGRQLLFNAAWSAGLDTPTRRFLQAHLTWHCVAGHLYSPQHWERRRWHLACDHEVNALLLLLGIQLHGDAVLFPACIGQSPVAVYDWLDHFPGLESERSLDMPPATWGMLPDDLADTDGETPLPADETLMRRWQGRALEVAKRYLGTPHLPCHVAAFLVTRQ